MRVAVVDFRFMWPPDGGSATDVKEILSRLSRDHNVCLFVPEFQRLFPRGRGVEDIGVPFERISSNLLTFQPEIFSSRLHQLIDKFQPDCTFFTDGWYIKSEIIRRFSFRPYVIRYYAYEGLCLRQHGTFFRNGCECNRNLLLEDSSEWRFCSTCARRWMADERQLHFIHEFLISRAFSRSYRRGVIQSLANAQAVICYNQFIAKRIHPFNNRIYIIPSGINISSFSNLKHPPELEKDRDDFNILMVGRKSDPTKGFQVLKKAVSRLILDFPNIRLHVTSNDRAPGSESWMITHPWMSQESLPELYSSADLCVVPSLWPEPFGIVVLEAMAAGVPVIVSDAPGPAGIVTHMQDGLISPRGDDRKLAEAIRMIVESPALAKTLTEQARLTVEHYSWDKVYRRVERVLFSVASGLPAELYDDSPLDL
ncbi:MAG: glycosyltransferase family 4 protein [Acidobacteria bacterium]|nr:glycosyltransferase family 4 protein [Acidobacteriota bacterium]